MTATVYFATNRVLTGPAEKWQSYASGIVSPSDPTAMTYGTAFVEDANLTADTTGAIDSIQNISKGGFDAATTSDLSAPGRNLLIFIHGFDNSFENALTRAAFNQQWFMQSGVPAASTTVVAFSWPSLGKLLSFPVPWSDYLHDQTMAGQSDAHLMSFFTTLRPILTAARASGVRTFLLAHSMGNWALQAGVESWFAHGNGATPLFDEVILAAADERYDSFGFPMPGRLSGLHLLTKRTSIYFSQSDAVLQLSMTVNLGAQRLGQQGPQHRSDPALFPPASYRMIDCTNFKDYDVDFASSHQYYRRSPKVRADIASVMDGAAPMV
jgi:esterase/lipase superfamily enzyme